MLKPFSRIMLCFLISFTLVHVPIMKTAHAGMISTGDAVSEMSRTESHKKVADFLKRDDVKKQFMKFGVSAEEAELRVASLSDAELQKLAGEIDKNTAGGSVGGILVIVLLVVLIIYFAKRI